jgi:chromosome segregation ATPase
LTKAIGHMNATLSALQDDTHTKIAALGTDIAASAATTTSLIKTAEEGIRLDTAESIASLAINTTNAIQAMQNTIFTDVNAHSQALQEQVTAVNSTTAMQLVLLESSLAASLQDVSTEITLVTQQLQGEVTDAARNTTAALAQQKTDMLQQLQAFNATLLARWESQNKTVSSAIESLVVVVATQLDNLKQSAEVDAKATEAALSKLQESVAGSTSTLSERLSGVLGRASKLEEQTALLLQASSTTREKLALLDHSHTTHSEAVRERKTSADAQATTWNALHATYATQLQSLNSQITTLQKGLDKSEAALLAATGVANSLKETNINLTTRLEKMESTERKEEESVAALRERITRLETLVEVLMKK